MGSLFAQLGTTGALAVIALLILSLAFHEAAHAFAAYRLGDPTAKRLGRLTLNPLPHIDPVMTIIVPTVLAMTTGFIFGGAKPVPVDPRNFRSPHRDNAIVALAGPLSNILLAMIGLAVLNWMHATGAYEGKLLRPILGAFVFFNILLAVFNAIPIPPLDGSRVLAWLLPGSWRPFYGAAERFGILIIFAMFFLVPGFQSLIGTMIRAVAEFLQEVVTLGGTW